MVLTNRLNRVNNLMPGMDIIKSAGESILIGKGWDELLSPYVKSGSFRKLLDFVSRERREQTVYPHEDDMFNAFSFTPPEKIKVVIVGQDPYHGLGQAQGLAFSVPQGVSHPPSLKNIFKELKDDLDYEIPESGSLESWARQGVLLLNTVLTVRANSAGSHRGHGWEEFTDHVIETVSEKFKPSVFMLWGGDAQRKEKLIDPEENLVLKAAHPSPLSAYRGFFGCRHFSRANEFLSAKGLEAIDW